MGRWDLVLQPLALVNPRRLGRRCCGGQLWTGPVLWPDCRLAHQLFPDLEEERWPEQLRSETPPTFQRFPNARWSTAHKAAWSLIQGPLASAMCALCPGSKMLPHSLLLPLPLLAVVHDLEMPRDPESGKTQESWLLLHTHVCMHTHGYL